MLIADHINFYVVTIPHSRSNAPSFSYFRDQLHEKVIIKVGRE